MTVRLATLADAPAIARIHSQGIEERIATFETEPRTAEQVGVYRRHGQLDGQWRDCVVVERLLGAAGDNRV